MITAAGQDELFSVCVSADSSTCARSTWSEFIVKVSLFNVPITLSVMSMCTRFVPRRKSSSSTAGVKVKLCKLCSSESSAQCHHKKSTNIPLSGACSWATHDNSGHMLRPLVKHRKAIDYKHYIHISTLLIHFERESLYTTEVNSTQQQQKKKFAAIKY